MKLRVNLWHQQYKDKMNDKYCWQNARGTSVLGKYMNTYLYSSVSMSGWISDTMIVLSIHTSEISRNIIHTYIWDAYLFSKRCQIQKRSFLTPEISSNNILTFINYKSYTLIHVSSVPSCKAKCNGFNLRGDYKKIEIYHQSIDFMYIYQF